MNHQRSYGRDTVDMHLNQGYEYRERLGPKADGQSVVAYLSRNHPHSSYAEWTARIADGQVLIDGRSIQVEDVLHQGSELIWRRPPWVEPDAPTTFAILYEDEDLLAVAKPAGLPTLPGANFLHTTLLYQVRRHDPEAAPLHRLGRWTSGVVLCARNQSARADLVRQWTARRVVKRYRALAVGDPKGDALTIDTPIGPVPHALLGSVHAACDNGKPALTHVEILERRDNGFLCDVTITTGRPHQIRIHLAAAGYPLLGDPLYVVGGLPAPASQALPGDPGYHLHAAELRVTHPRDDRELVIVSEPPWLLRRSCPS